MKKNLYNEQCRVEKMVQSNYKICLAFECNVLRFIDQSSSVQVQHYQNKYYDLLLLVPRRTNSVMKGLFAFQQRHMNGLHF